MPTATKLLQEAREIMKSPPGRPPRPGLVWHESTHRWRRPGGGTTTVGSTHSQEASHHQNQPQLTRVGRRLGRRKGGLHRTPQGKLLYIRWTGDLQARLEVLAAELYQAAGLRVPVMQLTSVEGQVAVQSEWLSDAMTLATWELEASPGVREGFVVDAWLANWDVIGIDSGSIREFQGRQYRMDVSGALVFRASGKPKPFTAEVIELEQMRDPIRSEETSQVFSNLTMRELSVGAKAVAHVSEEMIDRIVERVQLPEGPVASYPGPANLRLFIATRLKQRRAYIVKELLTGMSELMHTLGTYQEIENMAKAPPGLPPKPGWVWHEETRRWRNPANWVDKPDQGSVPEPEPEPKMGTVTGKIAWREPMTRPGPKGTTQRLTLSGKVIPPAWRGVRVNSDPKGNWQAIGVDVSGRTVGLPGDEFVARNAKAKFKRSREFSKDLPSIRRQVAKDFGTSDEAKVLAVIDATSFRVGGEESDVYGISTLRGKHVRVRGNLISFEFMGKKKQLNQKTIQDNRLSKMLK